MAVNNQWTPTLPALSVNLPSTSTTSAYTPGYDPNSQIGQIVNQIGQYLTPSKGMLPIDYNTYSAPQMAVFNQAESQWYRPEFEKQTLNPYKQTTANQMAAGGNANAGWGQQMAGLGVGQQEQGYSDMISSARNTWQNMIRDAYNQAVKDYGNSPTNMTNIGA